MVNLDKQTKIQNGTVIKMRYKYSLLAILFLITVNPVFAGNLLKNSNFEIINKDFPAFWANYGKRDADSWVKVLNAGKNGQHILELQDSGIRGNSVGICQKVSEIKAGTEYLLEVKFRDVKSKNPDGFFVQLRFMPSGKKFSQRLKLADKNEFDTVWVRGTAPQGTDSAMIYAASTTLHAVKLQIKSVKLYDMGSNVKTNYAGFSVPLPDKIPDEWLNKSRHPLLVCSREDYFKTRKAAADRTRIQEYLQHQKDKCDRFIDLNDAQLRAMVPSPGSPIVYGLGNNTDPVKGERLVWAGWNNPFKVKDKAGNIYPNDKWPDDKYVPGQVYYWGKNFFTFRAYGFVHHELEQVVLPALADCYALTGDSRYAHAGAVLLDALAAAYPKNRRGPIDYPNAADRLDRCGRLDRANYMVARGLYNYATAIDLIAPSGEFDKKSLAVKGMSIRENIIKNMLWDGAQFCLSWALENSISRELNNGSADYFRGSGIVGTILGERTFFDPMAKALQQMIDVNIDRNGFYYETSTTYENHTITLYATMAELVEASIIAYGWKDCKSFFSDSKLSSMISEFFNRREIGGHMPPIGDDGPDVKWNPPLYRNLSITGSFSDRFLSNQVKNAWIMLVRGKSEEIRDRAAALLKNSFPDKKQIVPENERWTVFNIDDKLIDKVNSTQPVKDFFDTESVFYGAKGVALLRGGKGEKRYGAQLFFGPISIHGQWDIMSWLFVSNGVQWSFDPGYCNSHYRFGWNSQSVSHQMMTVNKKSIKKECGNGFLQAWLDTPEVQWLMASHPTAYYDQGVKDYKRFLGQVQNPETGKLAYWLDIGMVGGGRVRDDSFHTIMTEAKYEFPVDKLAEYSMYGDKYKGMSFGANYRLSGFSKEGFYWIPPGNGYGFLIDPVVDRKSVNNRITFSAPGFKLDKVIPETEIVTDFVTRPGVELYVTRSTGAASWIPSVPYIIRRHKGDKPSVFTKVIRVVQKGESDPVNKVYDLNVSCEDPFAGACVIEWENGRRDIWFAANGSEGTAKLADGRDFATDALTAMVTLDNGGSIIAARMSGGTYLRLGDFELKGQNSLIGEVVDSGSVGNGLQLKVKWNKSPEPRKFNAPLMVNTPAFGLKSTWKIKEITGGKIVLDDFSAVIAKTVFAPTGISGWYKIKPQVSSFSCDGKIYNENYLKGKRIVQKGKVVAVIAECRNGMYHLIHDNNNYDNSQKFTAEVVELAKGDKVTIPVNSIWKR